MSSAYTSSLTPAANTEANETNFLNALESIDYDDEPMDETAAEQAELKHHPLLRKSSVVGFMVVFSLCGAMAIVAAVLGALVYREGDQVENTFDSLNLAFQVSDTSTLVSTPCFTCVNKTGTSGFNPSELFLTFNGQLMLSDAERANIQFPVGVGIDNMRTITETEDQGPVSGNHDNTFVNGVWSYVQFTQSGTADDKQFLMAPNARISTWTGDPAAPTSTLAVVPGTIFVGDAESGTNLCADEFASGTSFYSAYKPGESDEGNRRAVCVCIERPDANLASTELCVNVTRTITA